MAGDYPAEEQIHDTSDRMNTTVIHYQEAPSHEAHEQQSRHQLPPAVTEQQTDLNRSNPHHKNKYSNQTAQFLGEEGNYYVEED